MSTYTLPSPLDDIDLLWYPSRFTITTRQRPGTHRPSRLLWIIIAPFPFFFGLLQRGYKCSFIVVGPYGLTFGTFSLGVIVHWELESTRRLLEEYGMYMLREMWGQLDYQLSRTVAVPVASLAADSRVKLQLDESCYLPHISQMAHIDDTVRLFLHIGRSNYNCLFLCLAV
jgi:hypothetical protein